MPNPVDRKSKHQFEALSVDFVIWDEHAELILETKARSAILPEDIEQCLLYLEQGNYPICLLVNFGQKPVAVRRFVNTPRSGLSRDGWCHEALDRDVLDHDGHERTR